MSTKKPMLLLFAGPNGSGKSTITSHFDTVGEYTNADDVASLLRLFFTHKSVSQASIFAHKSVVEC